MIVVEAAVFVGVGLKWKYKEGKKIEIQFYFKNLCSSHYAASDKDHCLL